jgi:SHS2 domain-containing protein/2-hydroxy-3-keto-5-methylthiopentenyl-1-phosphate phosphatase
VDWDEQRFRDFLGSLDLDSSFADLWSFSTAHGARLLVLSDGLDLYLDPLMARLGLSVCAGEKVLTQDYNRCVPRFANHAFFHHGRIHIEFPHASDLCDKCANCKLAHLMNLRPHFLRVIYVGDGYSDLCPAKYADIVFAKSDLANLLSAERVLFLPFQRLSDILCALGFSSTSHDFEILDHTADYALRAWGSDLSELITSAARGMISLMLDTTGLTPTSSHSLSVDADTPEVLVHHALRELLYLFEEGMVPVAAHVQASDDPLCARLVVCTVPARTVRNRIHGHIKAVTYHNLHIRQEGQRLVTDIVLDT